jgi:DNA-binding NarL/FixJ family response regulator
MSNPVKILLIEPSVIIRSGLLAVLNRLNTLQMDIYEIPDIEHLKATLPWQKPDILIINPLALGVFSLQQIRRESVNPDLKFVALQTSLSDTGLLKAYDTTISIYDSAEQIHEKLTLLLTSQNENIAAESLTSREKEILICIVKGLTNKQIADTLHLSSHTVVSHRRNISSKLQIHSAAGLTIYAIVNKLIELNEVR